MLLWSCEEEFPTGFFRYFNTHYSKIGALIVYDGNLNIRQYTAMPHPYQLPNFMDVFTWSMPFLAEKVTDILRLIYMKTTEEVPRKLTAYRREIMRIKILAIARMLMLYNRSRANREKALELHKLRLLSNLMPLRKKSGYSISNLKELDSVVRLEAIAPSIRRNHLSSCEDDSALSFDNFICGEAKIVKARSATCLEIKRNPNGDGLYKKYNNNNNHHHHHK